MLYKRDFWRQFGESILSQQQMEVSVYADRLLLQWRDLPFDSCIKVAIPSAPLTFEQGRAPPTKQQKTLLRELTDDMFDVSVSVSCLGTHNVAILLHAPLACH
jgi:hypothetical protein